MGGSLAGGDLQQYRMRIDHEPSALVVSAPSCHTLPHHWWGPGSERAMESRWAALLFEPPPRHAARC